jgi:hypothetical protein
MGLSSRIFLIDNDGVIYRMSNKRFARMLRHPEDELLPDFASQRIRCADLVIELIDRVPTSVCRETFAVFEFDQRGCIDRGRFEKQQVALVDAMLEPILSVDKTTTNVVDATQRFIAQGGAWTPSKALRVQIEKAALGIINCLKL